jgi:hypothetical protein
MLGSSSVLGKVLKVATAGFFLAFCIGCSDPVMPDKEPLPEFPAMDTTTHEYMWSFIPVGPPSPREVNYVRSILARSDTDVWMIGYIYLDGEKIISFPSGRSKNWANVTHWDGSKVSLLSYEAIVGEGGVPSPSRYLEILEVNGNVWLMTAHGYTELLSDTVRMVRFEDFRTLPWYSKMKKGHSGRVYWYNDEGDLAYLDPSDDERLIKVETFSKDVVRDFSELEVDRYLISRKINGGQDYVQEISGGTSRVLNPEHVNDSALGFSGTMWSNGKYLYYMSPFYLYIESIADRRIRTEIMVPNYEQRHGYLEMAKGRAENDVFWVGHTSTVFHYNGETVNRWMGLDENYPGFQFRGLSLTENAVYIAGLGGYVGNAGFFVGTRR